MPDRAGLGPQVARENRRHSGDYVEDFRGRPVGREQARWHQNRSVGALGSISRGLALALRPEVTPT